MAEIKNNKTGKFVTLTFENKWLDELENEIKEQNEKINKKIGKKIINKIEPNIVAGLAIRRFTERWRKSEKKTIKHWLIPELGHNGTERLHIHGIIFTEKNNEFIEKKWMYGKIWVGDYVNEKTINYIIKYITKTDEKHKNFQGKVFASNGIGANYIGSVNNIKNKYNGEETKDYFVLPNGSKTNMPIYYRNKTYNEEEREKLWINTLNKKERYINGMKIDISTKEGELAYEKALDYAQKIEEAKHGNPTKWEKEHYKTRLKILKN